MPFLVLLLLGALEFVIDHLALVLCIGMAITAVWIFGRQAYLDYVQHQQLMRRQHQDRAAAEAQFRQQAGLLYNAYLAARDLILSIGRER